MNQTQFLKTFYSHLLKTYREIRSNEKLYKEMYSSLKNHTKNLMTNNKKNLTCQKCRKWFEEDNLIISPKGAFCEDCYYE